MEEWEDEIDLLDDDYGDLDEDQASLMELIDGSDVDPENIGAFLKRIERIKEEARKFVQAGPAKPENAAEDRLPF